MLIPRRALISASKILQPRPIVVAQRFRKMTVDAYKPFLLSPIPGAEVDGDGSPAIEPDWTADLELDTVKALAESSRGEPLRVLVLYGSLRHR